MSLFYQILCYNAIDFIHFVYQKRRIHLHFPLISKYICSNINWVMKLTKIKNYYNSLGRTSKAVAKCTLALALPLLFISLFSGYAHFTPFQYELLIISDELFLTARSILTTGVIGTFILNYLEKAE